VKRVYLAGPPYAEEYRQRAVALVRAIGWEPVDPMRRDYRDRTVGNEAEIVEGDLVEIESCDAVLAAFTSADEGTSMEAWYAYSCGKPVVAYTGGIPPHPWTVYVAATICADLEEAVRALLHPQVTSIDRVPVASLSSGGASFARTSMPPAPIPPDVDAFLRQPNPAVVASLRGDGSPHTVATWYAWEDNRILLSMDESRVRLRFMRRDPRVALTVLDEAGWGRHVSLIGRVAAIDEDVGLHDIDRLAVHYTGEPFAIRDRRRFSARIEVDAWHGWAGVQPWAAE
jgi:PPOX class probable F420-dependent enzyme